MAKYRYLTLNCEAQVNKQPNGMIEVVILDPSVNPLKKALRFEDPLDSLVETPGSNVIQMVAAFNEEWFNHHTTVDKFEFRDADTGLPITKFSQLKPPGMDPVRP
ncbi:hypothetical protein SAMN04487996_122158 [Dyadobacter soli]|uniref:Uncharacterized protein n=1 Tax=Dyadobacter soli TaxID=659014 RepID=A0A1G7WT15_9BACT|nr:hypothetical protein [Dyadobacter soli]SDG75087.1 hypothetical protein SAMN04487996_122158 [Dyadobacter soli]